MTIGQRITELRKAQGLSQEALGCELGLSRQAVSRWEADASLPEIDNLVALAKLFHVSVGYLLGVEALEDEASPAEQTAMEAAQTQKLEEYLSALTKSHRVSKWLRAGACVVLVAIIIGGGCLLNSYRQRLNSLNSTISGLEDQLAILQSGLGTLSDSISEQVEEAINQQYGITAGYDVALMSVDCIAGTAEISVTAVLRTPVDSAEDITLVANLSEGESCYGTDATWNDDTNQYAATLTVPLVDGAEYYLITPEGTVQLSDCGRCDALAAIVELDQTTLASITGDNSGQTDLTLYFSAEVFVEDTGNAEPTAVCEILVNGETVQTLTMTPESEVFSDGVWYDNEYNLNFRLSELLSPAEGDEVTFSYTLTVPDGRTGTGYFDLGAVWTENGWTVFSVDEDTGERLD